MGNEVEEQSAWLASVEAEGRARRARVLFGGEVMLERNYECVVVQSRVEPDGGMQYVVQCPGGQIIVERKIDGQLNGYAQSGYVGDRTGDAISNTAIMRTLYIRQLL
jgi:hypothetical protein